MGQKNVQLDSPTAWEIFRNSLLSAAEAVRVHCHHHHHLLLLLLQFRQSCVGRMVVELTLSAAVDELHAIADKVL